MLSRNDDVFNGGASAAATRRAKRLYAVATGSRIRHERLAVAPDSANVVAMHTKREAGAA